MPEKIKITHYDLFAGIGGFSYALDTVFYDQEIKHIFCEWEAFPTAILKKHWPDATYYGDIADLVADTNQSRLEKEGASKQTTRSGGSGTQSFADTANAGAKTMHQRQKPSSGFTIVTGGFPCQPFSQAGRRQGTSDDRYKWPEMFQVIRNVRPDWVIAENVRGFVTWNDGLVLERTCTDLESAGYEVQPFIIPACAVGAPHQRERVWIVAHTIDNGQRGTERTINATSNKLSEEYWPEYSTARQSERTDSVGKTNQFATNPTSERDGGSAGEERCTTKWFMEQGQSQRGSFRGQGEGCTRNNWERNWREVAFATCHDGVDDGLPRWMDGVTISPARHRKERLKACGNAIVPQVAMEIFTSIKNSI